MTRAFREDEAFALELDQQDPLRDCRERFLFPDALTERFGDDFVYFCGNSLGLQPRTARRYVEEELDDWARYGVEGHFHAKRPWVDYHERFRPLAANLIGAREDEVVIMNSLTVNLHLLMVSFYRPTEQRYKILIEDDAFPSDSHAVRSQLRVHGFDPDEGLLRLRAPEGAGAIDEELIEAVLEEHGDSIALFLLGGVNYLTGQLFDIGRIAEAARRSGVIFGVDLAHAAGNVPLRMHDWGVDFASWCSYKYLNAGPGAVAGAFVHQRHLEPGAPPLPRFEGWWGHQAESRFEMGPEFHPAPGVDAWQLSNPPILSMAPLLASLEIFDEVGMEDLRTKSFLLTGYLERLLDELPKDRVRILTPRDPNRRGAQLSVMLNPGGRAQHKALLDAGLICDFRSPNVIRLAPAPLYNSFHDCWRAAQRLRRWIDAPAPSERQDATA